MIRGGPRTRTLAAAALLATAALLQRGASAQGGTGATAGDLAAAEGRARSWVAGRLRSVGGEGATGDPASPAPEAAADLDALRAPDLPRLWLPAPDAMHARSVDGQLWLRGPGDADGPALLEIRFAPGGGEPLERREDRDGDGRVDLRVELEGGEPVWVHQDRDGDGRLDRSLRLEDGLVRAVRFDRDGDGRVDARFEYAAERRVREEHDFDGDGAFDFAIDPTSGRIEALPGGTLPPVGAAPEPVCEGTCIAYLDDIRARVYRLWRPPAGVEGSGEVVFKINAGGTVIRAEAGRGAAAVAASCARALLEASPLPSPVRPAWSLVGMRVRLGCETDTLHPSGGS